MLHTFARSHWRILLSLAKPVNELAKVVKESAAHWERRHSCRRSQDAPPAFTSFARLNKSKFRTGFAPVPCPILPRMMQRLLFLFLLLCTACESRAVNLVAPPEISPAADGATTLHWKLDGAAGGRLRYGLAPDRLEQTAADEVGADHTLTLRGLQPGTRYFYSIGTAKYPLTTGSFIAGSSTPTAKNAPAAPTPAPPPRKTTLLQKITGIISKPDAPKAETVPPVSPEAVAHDAPATRRIWGNIGSLPDHFARHGGDFGAKSQDDYAAQAWRFRERASAERLPMKLDTDGTVRVFDPKTRAFASFNRDGTTKTYFRPDNPSYWQRQPGKLIQTPPWVSQ